MNDMTKEAIANIRAVFPGTGPSEAEVENRLGTYCLPPAIELLSGGVLRDEERKWFAEQLQQAGSDNVDEYMERKGDGADFIQCAMDEVGQEWGKPNCPVPSERMGQALRVLNTLMGVQEEVHVARGLPPVKDTPLAPTKVTTSGTFTQPEYRYPLHRFSIWPLPGAKEIEDIEFEDSTVESDGDTDAAFPLPWDAGFGYSEDGCGADGAGLTLAGNAGPSGWGEASVRLGLRDLKAMQDRKECRPVRLLVTTTFVLANLLEQRGWEVTVVKGGR